MMSKRNFYPSLAGILEGVLSTLGQLSFPDILTLRMAVDREINSLTVATGGRTIDPTGQRDKDSASWTHAQAPTNKKVKPKGKKGKLPVHERTAKFTSCLGTDTLAIVI